MTKHLPCMPTWHLQYLCFAFVLRQAHCNWVDRADRGGPAWQSGFVQEPCAEMQQNLLLFKIYYYEWCKGTSLLLQIWDPQGGAVLIHSLSMKSRKRLPREVHLSPVPALFVTSLTDWWAHVGSTHGPAFAAFSHRFQKLHGDQIRKKH